MQQYLTYWHGADSKLTNHITLLQHRSTTNSLFVIYWVDFKQRERAILASALTNLKAAKKKWRTSKVELIFDSLLTSWHTHPPPRAHWANSLPPTHLRNNRVLLSCPALTQFLLITCKVYIKAERNLQIWCNMAGEGKPGLSVTESAQTSDEMCVHMWCGVSQNKRQGSELINRMVIVSAWVIWTVGVVCCVDCRDVECGACGVVAQLVDLMHTFAAFQHTSA